MPKKARTDDEVAKYKKHIFDTAVKLIVKDGYDNFSMRKLATKLGVSATAIYGYYSSKEVLYLNVLIEGFESLADDLIAARDKGTTAAEKAVNITRAYIDFGIKKANLYNIMLIWNVPKYNDFIGKPTEALAGRELECAMRVRKIAADALAGVDFVFGSGADNDAAMLEIMCTVHGFISFCNSQAIEYLSESFDISRKEAIIGSFVSGLLDNHRFQI